MSRLCRRHDSATWDEATDEWVCDRCHARWGVRRNDLGRPLRVQAAPPDVRGIWVDKPAMPDRWIA